MKRFFKKTGILTLVLSSCVFGSAFAEEAKTETKTDSNIELILKEKKNLLGDLLVKRFSTVKKIAFHKWNQKIPIDNEKQEKDYLTELSSLAYDFNVPTHIVDNFFSSQLDAQKAIEIQLFESWIDEDVNKHELHTSLPALQLELKNIDVELLKNLEHSKGIISNNSNTHLTDLANQLKHQGYPRDIIDDSLHFMKPATSLK